jgi:hypothetical protein
LDTFRLSLSNLLKSLALPRGLEPLFSPERALFTALATRRDSTVTTGRCRTHNTGFQVARCW